MAAHRTWRLSPVYARTSHASRKALIESPRCDSAQLGRLVVENPGCKWVVKTGSLSGVVILVVDSDIAQDSFHALSQDEWEWTDTLNISDQHSPLIVFAYPGLWRCR